MKTFFHLLGSLKLTVLLLAASMALIFFGTFDQIHWGIQVVQKEYFESFFCAYPLNPDAWKTLPGIGNFFAGIGLRLPMPGGFLVGSLLVVNLAAAHFRYFKPGWARIGIAVTHTGVLLLVISGFTTAALQQESMTVIPEGGSANWAADFHDSELALIDKTDSGDDKVAVIRDKFLRDDKTGGKFPIDGTALELRIHRFYPNAPIVPPVMAKNFPGLEPVKVDNGLAARAPLTIIPQPENFSPNARNSPSAIVEVVAGGKSLGTWLVNIDLAGTFGAQTFATGGRTYEIALRMRRTYFPFSLRLDKFTHDRYPGTDIPKNFASDVTLLDPREAGPRAVTISMNKPLRHDGLTFYQASFNIEGGTTTTALQTVRNPSRSLPYIAVALVGLGLLLQFGITLARFLGRKRKESVA